MPSFQDNIKFSLVWFATRALVLAGKVLGSCLRGVGPGCLQTVLDQAPRYHSSGVQSAKWFSLHSIATFHGWQSPAHRRFVQERKVASCKCEENFALSTCAALEWCFRFVKNSTENKLCRFLSLIWFNLPGFFLCCTNKCAKVVLFGY